MKNRIKHFEDYRGIADEAVLKEIQEKAKTLQGATVAHVNATSYGGGVAEMLNSVFH